MQRMKGMHGVTLYPDSSVVEVRVRLFNRTPFVQTFLWWANVAARVHDRYQSFFPPDVTYVADHAKRAMSTFPVSRGHYYGVDYGARPPDEADLTWYRNIPVPTSYMAMGSTADFFGGYDHAAEAGFVHWADHRISPGKKQWTWGNHEFGYAWDRELTDADGPYVELMAGVFTDNQPDFSFLQPYETRTFSQYWYPIRAIGPAHEANRDAAVSLAVEGRTRTRGCRRHAATCRTRGSLLSGPDSTLLDRARRPRAGRAIHCRRAARPRRRRARPRAAGRRTPTARPSSPIARSASSPASHRHRLPSLHRPARSPRSRSCSWSAATWNSTATPRARPSRIGARESAANPGDSRCNTALGAWHLRRGELADAERHLRRAIATLTARNPNPAEGEPFYLLGVTLRMADRLDEAEDAFGKAAWNGGWQAAAETARATVRSRRGDLDGALEALERALASDARNTWARVLRGALLRRAGRTDRALETIDAVLADDPLDAWALHERDLLAGDPPDVPLPGGVQVHLDVAHDYAIAGLDEEAIGVLARAEAAGAVHPLVPYTLAWLEARRGNDDAARGHAARGLRRPRPTTAFRPASRRSGSSRPPSCLTRPIPARPTTSATCCTTAAGTTRRSGPGVARPRTTRASRSSSATSASPSTTSGAGRSPPGPPTCVPAVRPPTTPACSTSSTSCANASAKTRPRGWPRSIKNPGSSRTATT